jgi:hypothetical protein
MTNSNNSGNNSIDPNSVPGGNPGTATTPPNQTLIISPTNWTSGGYITYVNAGSGWSAPFTIGGDLNGEAPVQAKKKSDGCSCKKCKDYSKYAEPNQEDGSFICYRCRKGL